MWEWGDLGLLGWVDKSVPDSCNSFSKREMYLLLIDTDVPLTAFSLTNSWFNSKLENM